MYNDTVCTIENSEYIEKFNIFLSHKDPYDNIMCFEYRSPELRKHDSRSVLMASTSFGLLLLLVAMLPAMSVVDNASGQDAQAAEGNNIKVARQVIEAFNTGDVSNVSQFISPEYFNHESQVDPVRGQLRGPEEFTDTVKNLRIVFADLHYEEKETIASGDKVISILDVTGKHVGNFFGIVPPTGHDISYEAVHIHRIGNDGKIV